MGNGEWGIRDRYAPSPTGLQHVGGIRTALFNYLFARSRGGTFVLRLEDTDRTRSDARYVQNLYDTFSWLGFSLGRGAGHRRCFRALHAVRTLGVV